MAFQRSLGRDSTRVALPYPLRMLVIGASQTGKTFLIRKMILRGDFGSRDKLNIAIYSPVPSSLTQDAWRDIESRGWKITMHKNLNIGNDCGLLILDDVDNLASAGVLKKVQTLFTVESHHSNLSVLMISHRLKTGSPAARESCPFVILTAAPEMSLKALCKELAVPDEIASQIVKHLLTSTADQREKNPWAFCYNHVILSRAPGTRPLWRVDNNYFSQPGILPWGQY